MVSIDTFPHSPRLLTKAAWRNSSLAVLTSMPWKLIEILLRMLSALKAFVNSEHAKDTTLWADGDQAGSLTACRGM